MNWYHYILAKIKFDTNNNLIYRIINEYYEEKKELLITLMNRMFLYIKILLYERISYKVYSEIMNIFVSKNQNQLTTFFLLEKIIKK